MRELNEKRVLLAQKTKRQDRKMSLLLGYRFEWHIKIVRELKYNSKRLQFAFDEYVRSFNKLVKQPEAFKDLAADFEDFDLAFRKYAKLTDL